MRSLFISYNGALEPLLQSQGIPYLMELSKKGINIQLLSFEKSEYLSQKKEVTILKKKLSGYGIDWHILRYHKKPSLLATLLDIFLGTLFSIYLVITKKIEVIHCRSYIPAVMGLVLKKILRVKFIFDMRGLMADEFVDGGNWGKNSFNYKVVKSLEKKFLLSADAIVVLTERICKVIKTFSYLKNKTLNMKIIPCCVDLQKFRHQRLLQDSYKLKHLKGKTILIYVGSIGTWYLLKEMVDFFTVFKKRFSNTHFIILTHSHRQQVDEVITDKGLEKKDFSIIRAPSLEVASYISLARVGISFIKPVFSKQASSPTKLAEYLACGLPVIINSGIGDTEDLVKHNKVGTVISEFNEANYMRAIDELVELTKYKVDLEGRCRKVAENYFSLIEGAKKYFDIYQDLKTYEGPKQST